MSNARPWKKFPLIERIVGKATEGQIEAAYDLDHPTDWGRYTAAVEVEVRKDVIRIGGTLHCDGSEVGDFDRTLLYKGRRGVARHDLLQLEPSHRGHGIATEHYTRVIRFYQRTPIRRVELLADGDGPWIWPQFGFDLRSKKQKGRLRKLAGDSGFQNIPAVEHLHAANIATASEVGIESLRELARLEGPLRMYLDLDDNTHRAFLTARGIL